MTVDQSVLDQVNNPVPDPARSSHISRIVTNSSSQEEESSFVTRALENLGQYRPDARPEPVPIEIVPHPQAPLFDRADWRTILDNGLAEAQSTNAISPEMHEVIRQAGLVSLWFYGKLIAGTDGPYDKLTNHLHADMCNFRQKLLYPAARGAIAIFRGGYKTTIGTELASAWELHRDPDLAIRITGASDERAFSFFESVKVIFESESNHEYYPESWHSPTAGRNRSWNNDRIVLPNRTRRKRDPSLQYGGVGGKSAGIHVDLHVIDDPVEFTDLNAGRLSSTDMYRITNWIWANETSLLYDMHTSRLLFNGTRYAVDDVISTILPKVRRLYGYPLDGVEPNPTGSWIFYYRKAIEDGMVVFPESFTYSKLTELAENDWWTFSTQYLNDPQNTGIAEFSQYTVGEAQVEYVESMDEYFIELPSYDDHTRRRYAFSDCDITQATDPAATERYVSSKTSRSVVGVMARTPNDEFVFVNVRAGYIATSEMFAIMFENMDVYGQWVRATFLEQQGAFKALGSLLSEEENRRRRWLSLVAVSATGDKDATIRTTLQPLLAQGKIYAVPGSREIIGEEVRSFPSSRRKDVLDMMKIAIKGSVRPLSAEERADEDEYDRRWRTRRRTVTGYG